MTRYRPVPRTLSDILRRLGRRPSNAPELMSPERLREQRAPMVDPSQLFQGVTIRPSQELTTRQQVASEGMKTPASLFGGARLADSGVELSSPQQLDLLPGQPPPDIWLQPLPEPLPEKGAEKGSENESNPTSDSSADGAEPVKKEV